MALTNTNDYQMALISKNQARLKEGQVNISQALNIGLQKVASFGEDVIVVSLVTLPSYLLLLMAHLIAIHLFCWFKRW